MLLWHLSHSNSLRGPVNWDSSVTRWNSGAANCAIFPFMVPSLMDVTGYIAQFIRAKTLLCSTRSLACTPRGSTKHAEYKTENHIVTEVIYRQQITLKQTITCLSWHSTELAEAKTWSQNKKFLSSQLAVSRRGHEWHSSDLQPFYTAPGADYCGTPARRWPCQ